MKKAQLMNDSDRDSDFVSVRRTGVLRCHREIMRPLISKLMRALGREHAFAAM
jgi:hypothetical protein